MPYSEILQSYLKIKGYDIDSALDNLSDQDLITAVKALGFINQIGNVDQLTQTELAQLICIANDRLNRLFDEDPISFSGL